MIVPLFDLSRVFSEHSDSFSKVLNRCIIGNNYILGEEVLRFEDEFSAKVGATHCVGMSSGTDALLAIFMSLGLNEGDEVIVPSFTFGASVTSIIRAGLKPIFADIGKDSFHMSEESINKAITEKTKCILFVHLFGEARDLSKIKEICDEKNIFLVEDCAQSFGSSAGSTGIASAYSFFPAKNLGCLGDGGAVTTMDGHLLEKLRAVRSHGSYKKYTYAMLGGNFRLDAIQAGFLRVLIPASDIWIQKRINNANYYYNRLHDLSGIILPKNGISHAWNQYTIRSSRRDELRAYLDDSGVGNAIYYPNPIHNGALFEVKEALVETEKACKEVLSIPVYPGLRWEEREYVATKIREFFDA